MNSSKSNLIQNSANFQKRGMLRRDFIKLGVTASIAGLLSPRLLSAAEVAEKEAMLRTIDAGLPKTKDPKHVVVIGGGMAGLVAAYELKRAGHSVTLLEASRRIGGRVWTLREPFTHGLYAEGGAMRIPDAHRLTWRYIDKFGLETQPFIMERTSQYLLIDNKRMTWAEFQRDPAIGGLELKPNERGKTPRQLWNETVKPLRERFSSGGWEGILKEWGDYTTRQFLERMGWSNDAITFYGIVENQRARLNHSVTALLWEILSGSFQNLYEIKGGTDVLPWSFYSGLASDIRFDAKMTEIRQDDSSVTVTYKTSLDSIETVRADHAILAIPFPMLRHVEGLRDFSPIKWAAITGLNYDDSGKILLQCRERFWEAEGIFGGGSESDLGIRSTWYPQHANGFRGTGKRGVLLVSYTWARDARYWSHLSAEDRVQQATENLERLHPQIKGKKLIEGGASVMWGSMENFGGGFALFNPGQEQRYYEVIRKPEGRIHFAGEHTSLDHRWIEGAVESAIRTATEIAG